MDTKTVQSSILVTDITTIRNGHEIILATADLGEKVHKSKLQNGGRDESKTDVDKVIQCCQTGNDWELVLPWQVDGDLLWNFGQIIA